MLIDFTYFFGDIQIGQLSEQSVQDSLTFFINQYEPRLLCSLLGYETYSKLDDSEPRWDDLKTGAEYTDDNGRLCKWNGLYNTETKVSLIAYYVYCQYMENQLTVTGGAGEGKTVMQNAIAVSSEKKIRKAWNLMVAQNKQLINFLTAKKDIYPEWYGWALKEPLSALFIEANPFGI